MAMSYFSNTVLKVILIALLSNYVSSNKAPIEEIIREAKLTTVELIKVYGYPAEEHKVQTVDGYKLLLHRIPHGKINTTRKRIPVLLMHNLACSSSMFVVTAEDSLGFLLADENFDVWLGNNRNTGGTENIKYKRSEKKFWNFGLDEMMEYDMPAIIDYILQFTARPKILYVGHSLGSLIGFGVLGTKPEYNEKIAGSIHLGPTLSISYLTSLAGRALMENANIVQFILRLFGISKVLGFHFPLMKESTATICVYTPICDLMFTLAAGYPGKFRNQQRLPIITCNCVEAISIKTYAQLAQLYRTNSLTKFDYGYRKNLKKYGQAIPPTYAISNITSPVGLFSAPNDVVDSPFAVVNTRRQLKSIVFDEIVPEPMFTHTDYPWSKFSKRLVFDKLVDTLRMMWRNSVPTD